MKQTTTFQQKWISAFIVGKNYNLYVLPVVSVIGAIPMAGIRGEVGSLGQKLQAKRLYGNINNNNMDNNGNNMPSKSVSFSDEGYTKAVQTQPGNVNFSEWVEGLMLTGLFIQERVDGDIDEPLYTGYDDMSQSEKAQMIDELVEQVSKTTKDN